MNQADAHMELTHQWFTQDCLKQIHKGKSKMARYDVPKSDFTPCPEGQHRGVIYEIEDLGIVPTQFGDKHKIAVKIEVHTAKMDDDNYFMVQARYNLSSSPKSNFVQLRMILLGRKLTDQELISFDDNELLNKRVGLIVSHNVTETTTYANVDQIWPLDEPQQQQATRNGPPPQQAQQRQPVGTGASRNAGPQVWDDEAPTPDDEDLPF